MFSLEDDCVNCFTPHMKVVLRSNKIVRGNLVRQQQLASSPLVSCHFSNSGELRDTDSATQGTKHQASNVKRFLLNKYAS